MGFLNKVTAAKKFKIKFDRTVGIAASIEIEAETKEEAQAKFKELMKEHGGSEVAEGKKIDYKNAALQLKDTLIHFPQEDEITFVD